MQTGANLYIHVCLHVFFNDMAFQHGFDLKMAEHMGKCIAFEKKTPPCCIQTQELSVRMQRLYPQHDNETETHKHVNINSFISELKSLSML